MDAFFESLDGLAARTGASPWNPRNPQDTYLTTPHLAQGVCKPGSRLNKLATKRK